VVLLVAATEGELCGHEGLVCGVGPVEAAAATARSLVLERPASILHVGLAGARALEPGTIVVGTEAVYCDLCAEWPVVDRSSADAILVAAAAGAVPGSVTMPIHTSAAVGGAGNRLLQGSLVEAMEGFGVLRAAELAGVRAVEVRVISNEIGEPDRGRWRLAQGLAVLEEALPTLLDALRNATAPT
jgi:nucleoside phosphorylase